MDLTQLQLFKDIVQTRSISRGALQNGVTQSAASQTVQELERCLGAMLLDRSRRPLEVLPPGRLLYDFARDVLRRNQDFLVTLEELKGGAGGTVRVAAIYSVGISDMSRLEEEFYRRLPAAQLEVSYLRPEKVYQAVLDERVDLGLLSYPEATRDVIVLPWREEPMVVACSPDHPLAHAQKVHPKDLEDTEFIGFDEDLPISKDIDRFLRERGVRVHVVMRFDNIQSMKEALRLGHAVSILPSPMLRDEVAEGRLSTVPLDCNLIRPLGIIHRRRKTFPRAAQVFLDLLRDPAA
ncbi:LysR family transcriptional regulator [uncultured Paludibaculum sp.]|uniref:LysR family transcriptional regulator n=1 Tax=uncultured Paludibaculum sp. TaxID=1765020 RepID=UPI002AAA6D47|nr:LysR family transcriptional regulator [uncultured Paludibaculum sp.]